MTEEFNLGDTVAMLERTPASLSALLGGLSENWLAATDGDGGWSVREVIIHLIDGEQVNWIPRARHIVDGAAGPFKPFDRTAGFAALEGAGIDELLATFAGLRRDNLAALAAMNLGPADFGRTGRHPEFGEVRLGQLLATWVVHDLNHLRQLAQMLARVYAEAIGPWRAYLPIVHD